jgi:hypothetical protein
MMTLLLIVMEKIMKQMNTAYFKHYPTLFIQEDHEKSISLFPEQEQELPEHKAEDLSFDRDVRF